MCNPWLHLERRLGKFENGLELLFSSYCNAIVLGRQMFLFLEDACLNMWVKWHDVSNSLSKDLARKKREMYKDKAGASPVAEWLSSHVPLRCLGFCQFGSWAHTWHCSSGHAEAASDTAQPEGPTTRIHSYLLERFWQKKKKKTKRLPTDVSSGSNL